MTKRQLKSIQRRKRVVQKLRLKRAAERAMAKSEWLASKNTKYKEIKMISTNGQWHKNYIANTKTMPEQSLRFVIADCKEAQKRIQKPQKRNSIKMKSSIA